MPSVRRRRLSLTGGLVLLLLVLTAWPAAPAGASSEQGLSGRVRDILGNRVPDVEVLVVSSSSGGNPIAAVRSDSAGLFAVPGLLPGIYRVAAIKGGYLTFLGQVNTSVERWLEVIMQPAAAALATSLPQDATWSLRLPRRSLLRETDAEVGSADAAHADPRRESRPIADTALRMEVEQSFALHWDPRPEVGGMPGGQGTETRLNIASALGQRGNFRLEGVRESCGASRAPGESGSSAKQGAAAVRLDFSYDTSADARVAVKTFYGQRDMRLTAEAPEVDRGTMRQGQQSWGYDAVWSTQLDAASSLAVKLDFLESKLELPGDLEDVTARAPGEVVSHRSVGATGSYESLPATDHQIQVDFGARRVESPVPVLRVPSDSLFMDDPVHEVSGWSVGLEAQDTWRVSGPFSVIYGLGYRHSMASRDVALVVPRFGGSWSIDAWVMRFLVSYHRVENWGEAGPAAAAPVFRPSRPLGYEAELELPLGGGLRLSGATRSSPIQFDHARRASGLAGTEFQPVYLTDGNAAVDEDRVALIREGASICTFLELISGRVRGTVAPTLLFEVPFQWLSESALRYQNSRLGLRVPASGTDLLLDYRRMAERPVDGDSAGREYEQQSVELRMAQDLMRLRSMGNWRLLLALRMAFLDGEGADEWAQTGDAEPWSIPSREMSAGLSVSF